MLYRTEGDMIQKLGNRPDSETHPIYRNWPVQKLQGAPIQKLTGSEPTGCPDLETHPIQKLQGGVG